MRFLAPWSPWILPSLGCFGGLELAALLVAQVPADATLGGAGFGVLTGVSSVVFAALTALGVSYYQPWLRERKTADRLRDVEALNAALKSDVDDNTRRIQQLAEVKARAEEQANERVRVMAQQVTDLAVMVERIAQYALVAQGKLAAGALPPPPPEPPYERPQGQTGLRVLVVEDNAATRAPLAALLRLFNCRVTEAADVAEALALLDPPPDVVVLDLMLGGGDGVEVLRAVRARTLPTRVVVTTGRDAALLDALGPLKPDAVLLKPFDFATQLLPVLVGKAS